MHHQSTPLIGLCVCGGGGGGGGDVCDVFRMEVNTDCYVKVKTFFEQTVNHTAVFVTDLLMFVQVIVTTYIMYCHVLPCTAMYACYAITMAGVHISVYKFVRVLYSMYNCNLVTNLDTNERRVLLSSFYNHLL